MNIFEEAEGLRAIDLTAEKPTKAMTAAGPAVLKIITSANANVDIYFLCLRENSQIIRAHKSDTVLDRDARTAENNIPSG